MLGHTLTCPVTVLRRKFNSSKLLTTFSFSAFLRGFPRVFKHCKLNEKIEKKQTLDGETNHRRKQKTSIERQDSPVSKVILEDKPHQTLEKLRKAFGESF